MEMQACHAQENNKINTIVASQHPELAGSERQ